MAAQNPEIGKYLALGTNVIFYYDGDFYEVQDSPVETSKWDLNGNGTVDIFDLTIVAINFGNEGGKGDVNGDGRVDIVDLALVAAHFGQ